MRSFTSTVSYTADVATVRATQADPEFVRFLANRVAGKLGAEVRRADLGEGTLTITAHIAQGRLPSMARGMFPDGVSLSLVQNWQPVQSNGCYPGTFQLSSTPEKFFSNATFLLSPAPLGASRRFQGTVSVNIPLMGALVEGELARMMTAALQEEASALEEFLAGR